MVKKQIIKLVILLILLGIAGFSAWYVLFNRETDEAHIRRVLNEIVENITKRDGDGTTRNLINSKALPNFFTSPCNVSLGDYIDSGYFTSESITNNSMRVRTMFRSITPSIKDLYIEVAPSGESAIADFAASVRGVLSNGEHVDGVRDLRCKMVKIEGEWKVNNVNIREVLEK